MEEGKLMKREVNPPRVIENKCIGCEQCVAVCPSFVLEMADEKPKVLRGEWCIGCGHCGAVCPSEAILQTGMNFEIHPRKGEAPATSPEVLDLLIRERRSVRNYTADPVPEQILKKILDAGRYGPTGTNSQNVHYVVLTSPDQIEKLRKMTIRFYEKLFSRARGWFGSLFLSLVAGKKTVEYLHESLPKMMVARKAMNRGQDRLFYHAPVVIIAHAESWDTSSSFNCSVALYNCSLMAHTLGLGCCFNGFLVNAVNHSRKIKRWLSIPADHRCCSAMGLGYPNMKYPRLVPRHLPKVKWR
ncbi:MAG: 4Fe-4S dicluster domain-containing protein [Deltaproteobacteria bacterium]|nr:4Fe-4S dicluster domain-containing protein [Deltaproteobacteria bacterium]